MGLFLSARIAADLRAIDTSLGALVQINGPIAWINVIEPHDSIAIKSLVNMLLTM